MKNHIDQILGLPSPPEQLALPAPDPTKPMVQQRADMVVDRRGFAAPVGPDGQTAAESRVLAQPSGDVVVDARGNAAVGPTADQDLLENRVSRPTLGSDPEAVRAFLAGLGRTPDTGTAIDAQPLQRFDPNAPINPNTSASSAIALEAGQGGLDTTTNTVEGAPPRTFTSESMEDLQTALRAKDAAPALKQHAADEIAARNAEAAGDAPLTGDFKTRLDDVKSGLRGGWVQKLEATNPQELVTKVYDEVLVNQNSQSNVVKLAQRIGLLDADLNPTPKADAIEAQRTAGDRAAAVPEAAAPAVPVGTPVGTAPVAPAPAPAEAAASATNAVPEAVSTTPAVADPAFPAQWDQLKKDAGISRQRGAAAIGTPVNLEQAQANVFRALADDTTTRNGEASQVERLAQKMGLVTNDEHMDITPAGRKAYLGTPEGATDTAQAAREQGFADPAHEAAFQQGVREQVTGQSQGAHTTVESLAANEAGKVWAQHFVETPGTKTLVQTEAIRARQDTRTTGRAVAREDVKAAPLTPGQIAQRAQNRVLDAANLSAVNDSDVAVLRRMVRNGTTDAELATALQQVQGGKTLFTQPEAKPAVAPARPSRGQPIFKEMNAARGDTRTKTETRVQSEAAVRAYDTRNIIDFAHEQGLITDQRAVKLHDLVDAGHVAQAERLLKIIEASKAGKASFLRGGALLGGANSQFEQFISGKSFAETVQHMVDHAPSAAHRAIMEKVQALMSQVTKAGGHEFDIRIAHPGDDVPIELKNPDVRAFTEVTQVPAKATVWLKSVDMGPEAGVNYQLASHEIIHAVTMQAIDYADRTDPDGKTVLGRAVKDLRDLGERVVWHLNDRLDNGDRMTHTEFELGAALGEHNAFADPHEIIAWGLTNPTMQQYLQGIEYRPRESVFSKFVGLVRNVLGLQGQKYDTALTELLRVSEQVLGSSARDLAPVFARSNPAYGLRQRLVANATEAGVSAANRTVAAANDVTKQAAEIAGKVMDGINIRDLGVKARRASFGLFSQNHIDREYGSVFPPMLDRTEAKRQHDAIRGRFASMGDTAYQNFEALQSSNKVLAEKVGQLMQMATEFQIDPTKAFEDHTHLPFSKDDDGKITADKGREQDVATLQRLHGEAVKLQNDLSRGDKAGLKVFNEFRAWNEAMNYARMASEMHSLIASDPEFSLGVAGAGVNPMDTFMTRAELSTPEEVRAHWQGALDDQLKASKAFVAQKRGEAAAGTTADQRGMAQHLSPIEAKIAATYEALAGMARAPYFHLGRFGDNFASATIRKSPDGRVDPEAQAHVAQRLADEKFTNVQLSTDNTRPKFMARFEKIDQQHRFVAVLKDLHAGGWLDGELDDIKSGPRTQEDNLGVAAGVPAFVAKAISSLETDPRFIPAKGLAPADRAALEDRKQDAIQAIRDTWLESQPDSAISKVLTARYTVPGFDPDMIRSFAHRWNVGATNLAQVATSAKAGKAYVDMRSQMIEATHAGNADDPHLLHDLFIEMQKRDARNPIRQTADTFDKLRAYGHAYYLGLSPAYGAIQLMQVGTNALPELAKKSGYAKSFHALRRASVDAFAIMKAATAESAKLGPAHYADVALTENVLKNSGLPKGKLDFMRHMIASGSIDIGQSANALSQIARHGTGSKLDIALKYASAIGMHTETFSRLVTALAAHELHGGDDAQAAAKYAGNVVSNSMFDYQSWNTARQLGKQGFAGPITPLLTQFMTYSAQMTEKLYSEAASAIGRARPGETAEETKQRASESRTYLIGHLTAITALAGTLGLPFASVFATAIERMAGSKDEPYDATAAWRNFLASVLGKDVGEAVSRGLPRAIGIDLSSRVGEQDLLPFSQLLGDRRSWKESIGASLGRSAGASPEMLINIADAGGQFANGDIMGGMISALPVSLKSPLKAYQMTTDGYVDAKGQKLPMTPTAAAILAQLLGFTPAEKAEYQEARGDQQGRRVGLGQEAGRLRTGIVKAMTAGDQETARGLITQAMEFDKANPTFAVIPSLSGALQRQQQSRTTARVLKAPVGVSMADIAGQQLTGYANVNYQ